MTIYFWIGLVCSFGILFLLSFLLAWYVFGSEELSESSCMSCAVGFVGMFLFWVFTLPSGRTQTEYLYKEEPIYSINYSGYTDVRGSFVLGSGHITSEQGLSYIYYSKTFDGGYVLKSMPVAECIVYQNCPPYKHPYLKKVIGRKIISEGNLFRKGKTTIIRNVHSIRMHCKEDGVIYVKFYLPKGSIIENYNIKL